MAAKLMRAVQYDRYGGGAAALQHVEVPVPSPKKDELLLKVEAASLNPADWKIQEGIMRPLVPWKFPCIPGTCVAGEVAEVGSGVTTFKAGDKVIAMLKFWNGGALAQFVVSGVKLTAHRPPEVSATEGAGMPIASLTALLGLRSFGVKFDGTDNPANILVTAASGGVGHYAVQLAKLAGLHVTATCGARNIELVKSLGADEVLDYRTQEGKSLTSPSGHKYDIVINCAHGMPWSVLEPNLSDNGKVADVSPTAGDALTFAVTKVTFSKKQRFPIMLFPSEKARDLEFLIGLAKEKKLKTVIDSIFPLAKAEDAFARIVEGHATGKIIVEM
ncbi:hypothetical protein Taro_002165 [Colocasia esculenta]|uniref:Enoyl reductase (ER) domain-containing protein n=1 Tax=Colocasia esculenta TaxID=4460 RepID=A0A843TK52_COLES|nr:hypothetical protein [Colocasia esculenta]